MPEHQTTGQADPRTTVTPVSELARVNTGLSITGEGIVLSIATFHQEELVGLGIIARDNVDRLARIKRPENRTYGELPEAEREAMLEELTREAREMGYY